MGEVSKIKNRWAVHVTVDEMKDGYAQYKFVGEFKTKKEALKQLKIAYKLVGGIER